MKSKYAVHQDDLIE